MKRTEVPALPGFGSAALESEGFARAGRGLQAAVPRLNLRLSRRQSAISRPANHQVCRLTRLLKEGGKTAGFDGRREPRKF